MPLLPLETFVYPEDLLGELSTTAEPKDAWWVLHTKPRAEKALARRLLQRQVAFFLPQSKRQWRHRGRLQCSHMPLFPGYLFVQAERGDLGKCWESNLIARILQVEDQKRLQDDLRRVYYLMNSGLPLTPEDQLKPGALVEITCGALAGLEGRVLQRGKQLKLIIEVQFLQRGVSVEVESWMIQSKNDRPALQSCQGRDG